MENSSSAMQQTLRYKAEEEKGQSNQTASTKAFD